MTQEIGNAESNKDYLKRVCDYDPDTDKLLKIGDVLAKLKEVNMPIKRSLFESWLEFETFPGPNLRIGNSRRWTERRVNRWLDEMALAPPPLKPTDIDFDNPKQVKQLKDRKVELTVETLHTLLSFYYTGGGEPDSYNARLAQAMTK